MSKPTTNLTELLKSRRFAPFFVTQFLGAFNDNVFKNALVILIAFPVFQQSLGNTDTLVNLAAGLFILPFFLFSAMAGQIADKYEKSFLIRRIKLFEIAIMVAGACAFYWQSVYALLVILFLMGTQSAFFGPVKYSLMPQHLHESELVAGNAWVEMGTFIAILVGTIVGGTLISLQGGGSWIAISVVLFAVLGWWVSRSIPQAKAQQPDLKVHYNPFVETVNIIRDAAENRTVFLSVLGISWFWFLGASYLTQLPNYTKSVLMGEPLVVTALLTVFSVGIGIGSLLCEKLSGHRVELGLVPLGALGISLFGFDLYLSRPQGQSVTELQSLGTFLANPQYYRIIVDLLGTGISGGLFIVPLYALIQSRSDQHKLARIIAANNVLNALLMVASAILAIVLLTVLNFTIPQLFLLLAVLNVLVAAFVFTLVPEFVMRFMIWMLTHTMYRVKHQALDNIPEEGAALLVCNHVSYVDALLIAGACRRPIRFVMYEPIYRLPVLNFIFRTGKAIPITGKKQNPEVYQKAMDEVAHALTNGEVVCLFPEGKLSRDGEIDEFKSGVESMLQRTPVTVVPMALRGLWGSFFSHQRGTAMTSLPKRFWSRVELVAGEPMAAETAKADALRQQVSALRGDWA